MLVQLDSVSKSIGVLEILSSVSFIIEEKEKIALVGINGAGKTSVFRLLTGKWQPDFGSITKKTGIKLGYLPQLAEPEENTNFDEETKTLYDVLDGVFAPLKKMEEKLRHLESEMSSLKDDALKHALKQYDRLMVNFEEEDGYSIESRVKGVLRGLGFSENQWTQRFNELSGGQRTRSMLGKLLLEKSDLLLLDEPTNHLDIESVVWLEDYLKNFPGAVIIISHDRYFLDKVATKTIEIENKKSTVYHGNYTYFVAKKEKDRILAKKLYAENQKVIKHHEEVIKTLRSYKTEAKIILAKSREKLLAKTERVDKPAEDPDKMRLRLTPRIKSGNDVLSVSGLAMAFGELKLYEELSFELKKGDKTALIGPNGIGKTTLFKNIAGILAPIRGKITEGVNVRIGYYDQTFTFGAESESKRIFDEIADTYPKLSQTEIRNVLAAFMFKGDDVFKPISALSGGERGRVQLSKIMLAGANFLILDEPTNHLDVFSKEILEDALRTYEGTVIYISHDRYFINNTATKIFELTEDGITTYLGNYDYYIEKKASLETSEDVQAKPEPSQKNEWMIKKEEESNRRKKASKIRKLEEEIAQMENEIKKIDADLEIEENSRSAEIANSLFTERTMMEAKLTELLNDWAKCSEG